MEKGECERKKEKEMASINNSKKRRNFQVAWLPVAVVSARQRERDERIKREFGRVAERDGRGKKIAFFTD